MQNNEIEDDINSIMNALRDYTTGAIRLPEADELIPSAHISCRNLESNKLNHSGELFVCADLGLRATASMASVVPPAIIPQPKKKVSEPS